MPFLDVNGTSLFYEDTKGSGPPILFSHGLLWSGEMFSAQIEALRGAVPPDGVLDKTRE